MKSFSVGLWWLVLLGLWSTNAYSSCRLWLDEGLMGNGQKCEGGKKSESVFFTGRNPWNSAACSPKAQRKEAHGSLRTESWGCLVNFRNSWVIFHSVSLIHGVPLAFFFFLFISLCPVLSLFLSVSHYLVSLPLCLSFHYLRSFCWSLMTLSPHSNGLLYVRQIMACCMSWYTGLLWSRCTWTMI